MDRTAERPHERATDRHRTVRSGAASVLPDRWDLARPVESGGADLLTLEPGRPVELAGPPGFGLTRLGYRMLVEPSRTSTVVALDVRGWIFPPALWEAGVERDRLVVVRCDRPSEWPRVAAALFEGVPAVFAEIPEGVSERDLRRLGALARARGVRLALRPLRGSLPAGIVHLRLRAVEVHWSGPEAGHGRLGARRLVLEASGRGVSGMTRRIEVEDEGANVVRVVSGVVARPAGRAAG